MSQCLLYNVRGLGELVGPLPQVVIGSIIGGSVAGVPEGAMPGPERREITRPKARPRCEQWLQKRRLVDKVII